MKDDLSQKPNFQAKIRVIPEQIKNFILRNRSKIEYALLCALVIVLLQFILFPGKSGLNYRVGNLDIGFKAEQDIAVEVSNYFDKAKLTIKTQAKTYQVTYDEIGVQPDVVKIASSAVDYPLWQRLIPLSFISRSIPREIKTTPIIDQAKLNLFAERVAEEDKLNPIDAGIQFENETIKVTPSKEGYSYDKTQINNFFSTQNIVPDSNIYIGPQILRPSVSDSDANSVVGEANKILAKPPVLVAENLAITPDKKTLISLLTAKKNQQGKLNLEVDDTKLKNYLTEINKKLFVASSPLTITLLDGGEIARIDGSYGRGINLDTANSIIKSAVLKADGATVSLPIVTVKPNTAYNRTYTATQKGLQVLLNDLVVEKGDYGISVYEISGGTRVASASGDKRYFAASTYKLFVAYYIAKKIEANELNWQDLLDNGKTVEQCFEIMIVKSDNPCAQLFLDKFGSKNIQNSLKNIGINSSGFNSDGSYSTANDETLFLVKLVQGNLMNESNKNRLLDAMKRQIYRSGIPAGSPNSVVADKVGFLYGYIHDTAIVYGQYSTYVVTILSNGSSWKQIADTAKRIDQLLN